MSKSPKQLQISNLPTAYIIDDEHYVVEFVKSIMEASGFKVIGYAYDGKQAINNLQQLKPDLILLDISMPGQEGHETLQQIKAINQNFKVIVLSSRNTIEIIKQCKEYGASGYVLKTGGFDAVKDKINKFWNITQKNKQA